MKIRIIDLMDYYYGDHAKPDMAAIPGEASGAPRKQQGDVVKMGRRQRPLLVAAALLLVVTGGVALRLGLGHSTEGQAMNEGNSVVESIQETMPPELPAVVPESSVETEGAVLQTPSDLLQPSVLEGQWTYEENMYCEGNLFVLGGSFYTMTDNGPESIEMQNLNTTVDFHGTWEVDIDYAVIDGELVFRNNTDKNDYTIVDGEKMNWAEYLEWKREQLDKPEDELTFEDTHDLSGVEWITPQVAIARPLAGSADTVMLEVRRTDIAYMDNMTYPFFYNIFTGEITDPLGNVLELCEHGSLGGVSFNSALTRALVEVWGEPVYSDGSSGRRTYLCDLVTGEMTWVVDLFRPFLPEEDVYEQYDPEMGRDGSLWHEGSCTSWADNDTLLFEMQEILPLENEQELTDEDRLLRDPYERHSWLFAYNAAAGTMTYRQKDVSSMNLESYNRTYLHEFLYDGDESGFMVVDTATGQAYVLPEAGTVGGNWWDEGKTRTVIDTEDGKLLLIDDLRLGWVDLREHIEIPEETVTNVKLLTDEWLCLTTAEQMCFYRIPDDIPMSPLTEK